MRATAVGCDHPVDTIRLIGNVAQGWRCGNGGTPLLVAKALTRIVAVEYTKAIVRGLDGSRG